MQKKGRKGGALERRELTLVVTAEVDCFRSTDQPAGLTTKVRGNLASSGTRRVQAGPEGRRAGKRKTQHHLRIVRAMIEKQFDHSGRVMPSEIERRQIHFLKPPLRN